MAPRMIWVCPRHDSPGPKESQHFIDVATPKLVTYVSVTGIQRPVHAKWHGAKTSFTRILRIITGIDYLQHSLSP